MAKAESRRLTVFDTEVDRGRLRRVVKGLYISISDSPNYAIDVIRMPELSGAYFIEEHNGGPSIGNGAMARIVDNQVWVDRVTHLVRGVLDGAKINYVSGRVDMPRSASHAKRPRPVKVLRLVGRRTVKFD